MTAEYQETNIKLTDIIELKFLQEFQDTFAKLANVASIIVDKTGPITEPSNFTDFCIKYTRGCEQGRCTECDIKWGKIAAEKGEPVIYDCHSGLTDFAVPIMLNGKHIASILGGQVLLKKPNEKHFKTLAKELSVNENDYIEALNKIKIIPVEQVQAAANMLFVVANFISRLATQNFELIEKNQESEKAIKEEIVLRKIISSSVNNWDVTNLIDFIITETGKLFNADRCIFVEHDLNDKSQNFIKGISEYLASDEIKSIKNKVVPKKAITKLIKKLKERNVLFYNGITSNINYSSEKIKKIFLDDLFIKSYLLAPIYYGNDDYGLIVLHYLNKRKDFSLNEINLIQTIANQSAAIIHQAKLYLEVKRNEQYTRTILNNINDAIVIIDKNFIIQSCNPSVEKVWGYKSKECIGKSLDFLLEKCDNISCLITNTLYGIKKDGERFPLELTIRNIETEGVILLVFRDITERKKVEQMKNEFVSIVSHELRTPLTSIRGALGLITGSFLSNDLSEKIKELLNIANNNSVRLVNLINDILDIEKIEAGKMDFDFECLELMPIIEQSIQANMQYAQKFNVKIELENTLPQTEVKVDKNRLIQVITNLLSNAIKFSNKNSSVKIFVNRINNNVRVAVKNYGTCIPKEFHSKIFQKFAQADSSDSRQKGGTGLGLSISKAIIEQMNGHIDFISQNNETSFFFDLPEFTETEPVINETENSFKPDILICEDDKDIALLISMLLNQENYKTDIVYTAKQAKKALTKKHYDAMTLDLILPDENGLSLIRELREDKKTEKLPIIVVSIKAKEGAKELNGHFAVIDWIDKPIKSERLLSALRHALVTNDKNKPKILHVEDDLDILKITYAILENNANISQATNLKEAKKMLEQESFDLVLLDLELPDGNGTELLSVLNKDKDKKITTVIFSAYNVSENIAKQVDAVLLKSNTSNEDLLKIVNLIKHKKNQKN